jgi:hypothetical protein
MIDNSARIGVIVASLCLQEDTCVDSLLYHYICKCRLVRRVDY